MPVDKNKKRKAAQKKLEKLRKKAHAKVLKYQKIMEKVRRRAEKKALKYANIEKQLIDEVRPRVGDPVLPDPLPEAEKPEEEKKAGRAEVEISKRKAQKEKEAREKAERKRILQGNLTMYERFEITSFEDMEALMRNASSRDERVFYRTVLNLKLQIEQEKVIGEVLL